MRSRFTKVFESREDAYKFAERYKDNPVAYTTRVYPMPNGNYMVEVQTWSLD